ncbi:hypothetical protein Tco_0285077 [Tanacetum coccineum]
MLIIRPLYFSKSRKNCPIDTHGFRSGPVRGGCITRADEHCTCRVPDPLELAEHVPVYVPDPSTQKYHAPSDDDIQVEDQPYAEDASPTAESPGYIADSDSMEEDTDADSIDFFKDDDDDDDTDDKDEEPTEDEEEEEHPAPVDSSMVPVVDPVPSAGDTEAFKTDESAPTPRSPQTRVSFSQTRLCRA